MASLHQVEDHSCGSFDWEVVDLDSSEEVVDPAIGNYNFQG